MFVSQDDAPDPSTIIPSFLLDKPPRFSLDTAGVLGLLGGDDAVPAMATVHVCGNRRWLGWYNTPGSFEISKRLRSFAASVSLQGVPKFLSNSRGVHAYPTGLFNLVASRGPKFRAAHPGTVIEETGYLAALFMKECAAWRSERKVVAGRKTQPVDITIADLDQEPTSVMYPTRSGASSLFPSYIAILVSVGGCVLSVLCKDWFAFSLILVGIVASGVSCLVLGSADLVFTHPTPAKGSPAGDGVLMSEKDIVVLKGTEGAVNSITRGGFSLRFSSESHYRLVGWCSWLFTIQCLTQLLLIPQASLQGQILFLASLGVSALCNRLQSSLGGEKIHQKLLFQNILEKPRLTKYTLGTRTIAVVFILLVLQLQDPTGLLNELLPNDTKVWRLWKATIIERLHHPNDASFKLAGQVWDLNGFTQQEKVLLALLYEDAREAYDCYKDYLLVDSF